MKVKAVNSKTVYQRSTGIVAANLDDELVMMSVQAGSYYGVGGVGTLIWELLEQPRSQEELVEAVVADYDVERERCAADVGVFVEELIGLNLIEPI